MRIRVLSSVVIVCNVVLQSYGVPNNLESGEESTPRAGLETRAQIEAAQTRNESRTDDQETQAALAELYTQGLTNLDLVKGHAEKARGFRQAIETAPAKLEAAVGDESREKEKWERRLLALETPRTVEKWQRQLNVVEAELAAARSATAEIERSATLNATRGDALQAQKISLQQRLSEMAGTIGVPKEGSESGELETAKRWVQETDYLAIQEELRMVESELASLPVRIQTNEAQLASRSNEANRLEELVRLLRRKVQEQEKEEAAKTAEEARETQARIAGYDPVLEEQAALVAEWSQDVSRTIGRLAEVEADAEVARDLRTRFNADRLDTEAALNDHGLNKGLGRLLALQRKALPSPQALETRIRVRREELATLGVQRLQHQEQHRGIRDRKRMEETLISRMNPESRSTQIEELRRLIDQSAEILGRAIDADDELVAALRELDQVETALVQEINAYREVLDGSLIWLKTSAVLAPKDLLQLPQEIRDYRRIWQESVRKTSPLEVFLSSPLVWVGVLVSLASFVCRKRLLDYARKYRGVIGKVREDRISITLRSLFILALAAAPFPFLLWVSGDALATSPDLREMGRALGRGLLHLGPYLFALQFVLLLTHAGGVGELHFRWPSHTVVWTHSLAKRLCLWSVPLWLGIQSATAVFPDEGGRLLGRVLAVVFLAYLAVFMWRLLYGKRGVVAEIRLRQTQGLFLRWIKLWTAALIAFPVALAVAVILGYLYSVASLYNLYIYSLWIVAAWVLVDAIVVRWIYILQRRRRLEQALAKREAARQSNEASELVRDAESPDFDEAEVDIQAAGEETVDLFRFLNLILVAGIFAYTWSPILPALRVFDDLVLWTRESVVDGVATQIPITPLNLIYAALVLSVMFVLTKRLPALLEMLVFGRLNVSTSSRYTVVTLANYSIIAVGVISALNVLATPWSQLQWAVAALSVGIGFGLQEIVANFISGIILLFERPIRVGDVVSVGDTDGIVTNVRIRATTIRTWDKKELLVPNKELVTGRVVNWSLTDELTRVVVVVGVAYGTDMQRAMDIVRTCAKNNANVLDDPEPMVSFESFGDSSLNITLRAYMDSLAQRIPTTTDLHLSINKAFEEAGVTIPFPQRDVHLRAESPVS